MEIIKTESKQKLVKLDDLKPGDLFEFYDQLYMKSDRINNYSFKLIGCILLYNGITYVTSIKIRVIEESIKSMYFYYLNLNNQH